MKHLNVIASVILAAAVLLAAYAIGRLVRQSRMKTVEPQAPLVAKPNDVSSPGPLNADLPMGHRVQKSTPEERARIKEERAEKLAEMENMTDEEKLQLRDEWREKLRSRRGAPGRVPHLSPEEMEQIKQRWGEMSNEEKQAFRARMRGRGRPRPVTTTTENESSPNSPANQGSVTAGGAEPNEAGRN